MIEFLQSPWLISALLALVALGLVFGSILGYAAIRFKVDGNPIVDQVNAILPQTQCGQCGYPGCKPYATAIAEQDEAINRCPPGGDTTIEALANLLDKEVLPLDADGVEDAGVKKYAYIREEECIGCTKCIQACPVDAILGSAKHMHTVIQSECTGCDLCVEPCPVDCIDMLTYPETLQNWSWELPQDPQLIITDTGRGEAANASNGAAA